MSNAAAWIMVGGLSLAVAISLVALIVAVAASRRPGTPGPPGPVGPMGIMGEPGVCRCEEDPRRRAAEATRYRAVIHWDDREVTGYGPDQIIVMRAERDGQECVDRHGANWYTVERWTASRGWHELED